MKLRSLIITLAVLLLFSGSKNLIAQDAAAQKAMADFMAPGKMHEMLAKNVGSWNSTIRVWMAPGTEPVVSEGTSVYEMILGGRYLQSKHTATFMGMSFTGIGIDAFDNGRKIFVSTWYDNMGTGVLVMEGTYDEAKKIMTLSGNTFEPVAGKLIKVREVIKFLGNDHQIMEMYMDSGANEFKSMELEMKRVK